MEKLEKLTTKEILKILKLPGEWRIDCETPKCGNLLKTAKLRENEFKIRLREGCLGDICVSISYNNSCIADEQSSYRVRKVYNQVKNEMNEESRKIHEQNIKKDNEIIKKAKGLIND